MIAQIITRGNEQYGLLCAQPNWETEVTISLELPTDIAKEPITFNESRRAFAAFARYNMQWRAYLPTAADATELRIFFTRIRGESIIVPLWPDACEIASAIPVGRTIIPLVDLPVRYGISWIIGNDDFSVWEIVSGRLSGSTFTLNPGVRHAWPAGTRMYPLIVGRLAERPQPESITDETFEVDITIKENTAFGNRLTTAPDLLQPGQYVGPHIPAFATTRLWSVAPNHSRPLDWTEQPDVVYQQIGFLGQEQQRVYDHRNARGLEMEFYENTRNNITRIESFFRVHRGPVKRFMIPTWRGDMRMSADTPVPGHPTWIHVEETEFADPAREAQPGDPFIALVGPAAAIDPYQLSQAVQQNPIILPPDPPEPSPPAGDRLVATQNVLAHTASDTILSHLLLARFAEPKLEWTYITPYLATTRIKFQELPHEYENTPPALPEPAYLFYFVEDLPSPIITKYTSYENRIIIPSGQWAGTYTPAPFSFETVATSLKLDQEKLEFKSFKFDGNPLNKMWPFGLDGRLFIIVLEADARNPRSATTKIRFAGDVWSIDSDYNATALAYGNLFDRKFPRFLLSVSDNYIQFSSPTKITETAFRIAGTIASRNVQDITITSVAGHAKAAEYFAGGWLATGNAANLERRGILHSAPLGGNQVSLHIDRPLLKAQNNQAINLYPGYDGSIDQCDTKFNNRINFGGHPYIPNVNPAVKAMKAKNVQGGKK